MPVTMQNLLLGYRNRPVLRVGQLLLSAGRCLGVFGPNGSGKTTLLHTIAGLLAPIQGKVIRQPGATFGYLPQARSFDPAWPMTAFDAAALASSAHTLSGRIGPRKPAIREQLLLLKVDHLAQQSFATLSGGQQQRILLAGVLAVQPRVLLLDEPTDSLDQSSRRAFLDCLAQVKSGGTAIVLISHDLEDLRELADDLAHLHIAPDPQSPAQLHAVASIDDLQRHLAGKC